MDVVGRLSFIGVLVFALCGCSRFKEGDPTPADSTSNSSPLFTGSTSQADYGANKTIAYDSATMLDARTYGALGDGATDDMNAINTALADSKTTGKAVYLRDGIYLHSDFIRVDSAKLIGQSGNAVLRATDTNHGPNTPLGDNVVDGYSNRTIHVTGHDVLIKNIRVDATVTVPRYAVPVSDGIHVLATNVTIESVTVDGGTASQSFFGAGIHIDSWDNAINSVVVKNCLVINTNADRIRIAGWHGHTVTDVAVTNNMVASLAGGALGDDDFAFIGNDTTTIVNVVATGNYSKGPKQWGAGADFQGVRNGLFKNNKIVHEGVAHAPGVIVQVPTAYPGPASIGLEISYNELIGTGRNDTRGPLGAIAIDEGDASNISFLSNSISNSAIYDFTANGGGTKSNILFSKNTNSSKTPLNINNQLPTSVVVVP